MLSYIYKKIVIDFPKFTLFLLSAIIIFSLYHSKNFNLDASSDALLLEGDKDLKYLREINERYGSKDFLVLTYTPVSSFTEKETILNLSNYGTKSITNAKIQEHDSIQMLACLTKYHKNFLVGNKLDYTEKSKYSESKFVCNADSIDPIFKEIYRRAILPFYIFFITLTAASLALIDRNNINYNKYKIFLF